MPEILKKIITFITNELDSIIGSRHTAIISKIKRYFKLNTEEKNMGNEAWIVVGGIGTTILGLGIYYKNSIISLWENTSPPNIDTSQTNIEENEESILRQEQKIVSYKAIINQLRQIQVDDEVLQHLNTLGINNYNGQTISVDAINSAFRQMAKNFHPDKNGNTDAFNAITKAKESLLEKINEPMIEEAQSTLDALEESNESIRRNTEMMRTLYMQRKQIRHLINTIDETPTETDSKESEQTYYQKNSF